MVKAALSLLAFCVALSSAEAAEVTEAAKVCVKYDTDIVGGIIAVKTGITTIEDCNDECEQLSTCKHWTFVEERSVCLLKDRGEPTSEIQGMISGAPRCFGPRPRPRPRSRCLERNTDYYGNDIISTYALSPATCQLHCRFMNSCRFWSFEAPQNDKRKGICYAKYRLTGKRIAPTVISGPKYCQNRSKYTKKYRCIRGLEFKGTNFASIVMPDASACKLLCLFTPFCTFWTYNEKTKGCYKKKSDGIKDYVRNPDCISGSWECSLY